MRLTLPQLDAYDRDGFIILHDLFRADEVAAMRAELARVQAIETDHLVREKAGGIAKTLYRVHDEKSPTASAVFHAAARAPRMLGAAKDLLQDEALYIHHTKCNLKTAIDGSVWAWHQDYGTWKRDGMPAARPTTALIMLDQPTEMNGCLYFIPGSHKAGNLEPEFNEATGYKFFVVPKEELLGIMARSPEPVAITGTPGTVVFFDCNILHASGHNLSRHDRWAIYLVYNPVTNACAEVPNPRPEYVRSTDTRPLVEGSDDILAKRAPQPLGA